MSVPTHGPWCSTRLYQTRCWDCRETVYFFSCTCGSRVLFDDPEPPWSDHLCWVNEVRERTKGGSSQSDARYEVLLRLRRAGRKIPDALRNEWDTHTKIEASLKRSAKRTFYRNVRPDAPRDFPGIVMSIERNINMLKLFEMPKNDLARGLLGKLGKYRWHRLHLREHGADELGIVAEMRVLMAASEVDRLGVRPGRRVLVSVKPSAPPHKIPVWKVTEATVIG